jgi:hypothetical protein
MNDNDQSINNATDNNIKKHVLKVETALKEMTPQLFSEFLIERGASQICMSCGSVDLVVPESTDLIMEEGKSIPFAFPDEDEIAEFSSGRFVNYVTYSKIDADRTITYSNMQYSVHCMNCGFIIHYKAANAIKWYADKKAVKG